MRGRTTSGVGVLRPHDFCYTSREKSASLGRSPGDSGQGNAVLWVAQYDIANPDCQLAASCVSLARLQGTSNTDVMGLETPLFVRIASQVMETTFLAGKLDLCYTASTSGTFEGVKVTVKLTHLCQVPAWPDATQMVCSAVRAVTRCYCRWRRRKGAGRPRYPRSGARHALAPAGAVQRG